MEFEFVKNIHAVTVTTSTLPPHHATNGYIIGGDKTALLIDPIYASGNALAAYFHDNQISGIQYAAVTHPHPDHFCGLEKLLADCGGRILCHPLTAAAAGFQSYGDDRLYACDGGETLHIAGYTVNVLHTPGHSRGHLCFYVEEEKILFSGDTILGYGTTIISPPDGNMAAYMQTLKALAALDIRMICPSHGPIIEERAPQRIKWYIDHREMREEKIVAAMKSGLTTIPEITKAIYSEEDFKMHGRDLLPRAQRSVLAHMEKLELDGAVIRVEKPDGPHYELQA